MNMKLRNPAEEQSDLTVSTLRIAERNAFPNVRRVAYGTLILLLPAFEYGFTFLDLHRNLWAHLGFYSLLLILVREFLIRKTPKIKEEEAYPFITRTLLSKELFVFIGCALAAGALIYTRHSSFLFSVVSYLFASLFFSARKFSSKNDRFIAYAQLILATAAAVVLPRNGGMDWFPIFTTLLAASFYLSTLLK